MLLDFTEIDSRQAYQWMVSMIAPRPIAWVSTMSGEGVVNLAPFSFFNGITSRPPTIMFVPVTKFDGTPKDTLRNIEETEEFVINLVSADLAEAMNATAAALPYGESEFARFGIESVASERVAPPRVATARVALECKLHQIVRMGDEPGVANVVFGRILTAHVSDTVLGIDGRIDPRRLDLIGRMGGDDYCTTRDQFTVERPD
ncbi:flavin reductase family protein [Synoicihabitans lomoniglobus]|uniref:Flavin reductase family protein n=1 Tax=Synoicihabitans lomoniglobus TaxID=2909285 RepID=A0AAE9ZUF7_9BACT|nr:flavin reductase family protein [Opitutaceae bacterium LMO-M01]WED64302.1 flavin reductase family protein [Opitutaceae bacterium LMO-M01]